MEHRAGEVEVYVTFGILVDAVALMGQEGRAPTGPEEGYLYARRLVRAGALAFAPAFEQSLARVWRAGGQVRVIADPAIDREALWVEAERRNVGRGADID